MSDEKHTKEPWVYSFREEVIEVGQPGGVLVAYVAYSPLLRAESEANARLICAAPALLAACGAALPPLEKALAIRRVMIGDHTGGIARTVEVLKAALALARAGRT